MYNRGGVEQGLNRPCDLDIRNNNMDLLFIWHSIAVKIHKKNTQKEYTRRGLQ
jgi:hypothetical protein